MSVFSPFLGLFAVLTGGFKRVDPGGFRFAIGALAEDIQRRCFF